MSGTSDSRLPNQWQESPPGWRFDGWGEARGGRSHEPNIPLRPGGLERVLLYVGWSLFGVLLLAAGTSDDTGLGLAAMAVAVVNVVGRRIIRGLHVRSERTRSDPSDPA